MSNDQTEKQAAKSVDSIDWLDEEWLRQVAEKNGIDCLIDDNNEEYFDCDFESLRMFAREVGLNFIQLSNKKDNHE